MLPGPLGSRGKSSHFQPGPTNRNHGKITECCDAMAKGILGGHQRPV